MCSHVRVIFDLKWPTMLVPSSPKPSDSHFAFNTLQSSIVVFTND